jgi:hypothetical protein
MSSSIRLLLSAMLTGGSMCFPAFSEESSGNLITALGSTSVGGYVNTVSQWQTRASARDPVVGVVAIRPAAREGNVISRSPRSGAFKFFRGGDISRPLSIYFLVDGSATAGVDYVASSGGKPFPIVSALQPARFYSPASGSSAAIQTVETVRMLDWIVIPSGRRTVTVNVDPKDDRVREAAESVVISIVSDRETYPSHASVQIIDNDR